MLFKPVVALVAQRDALYGVLLSGRVGGMSLGRDANGAFRISSVMYVITRDAIVAQRSTQIKRYIRRYQCRDLCQTHVPTMRRHEPFPVIAGGTFIPNIMC